MSITETDGYTPVESWHHEEPTPYLRWNNSILEQRWNVTTHIRYRNSELDTVRTTLDWRPVPQE